MEFRIMHSNMRVEVYEYALEYVAQNPQVEIHVGCDSQNYHNKTVYVTTLVFRHPAHGGHVIYYKEKVPQIRELWTRLWGELERSLNLAQGLKEKAGIRVNQIDLDFNSDPEYPSNKLLSAASGYAQSMGYNAKAKPDLLIAAWAADVLCH